MGHFSKLSKARKNTVAGVEVEFGKVNRAPIMNILRVRFKYFRFVLWRGRLGTIEAFKEGCNMIYSGL